MYIRIEFEKIGSSQTMETFYGSPSGTCLTSTHAICVSSKKIRDLVDISVGFWYLDVDILNKHYFGVINSLNDLLRYPGVKSVDVLPIEGVSPCMLTNEQYDELTDNLLQYI